jgi:hypothetical protein
MVRTFTGLRLGLKVGIGVGTPSLQRGLDIRLGDVAISRPDQTYGGVVQYDLGKNLGDDGVGGGEDTIGCRVEVNAQGE